MNNDESYDLFIEPTRRNIHATEESVNTDIPACEKINDCGSINQLSNELQEARSAAFQAMMMSSELGIMLRFLQNGMESKTFESLSKALFDVLDNMNLKGSLHIHYEKTSEIYTDDGQTRAIEREIFEKCHNGQRIIDFGSRTIFTQSNCALLIRNMPINNIERYGMLRDNLCILLDVVQNRVNSIILEQKTQSLKGLMDISLNVIQNILYEMEIHQCDFTNKTTTTIEDMLLQLKCDFSTLDLDQQEEEKLIRNFEEGHDKLSSMFEESASANKLIRKVLEDLLKSLSLQP